jgi:predicted DNA-binding protein (MmcQ/YjbR family)
MEANIISMMEGWIKLHRQILSHWVFQNERYFKAWIIILMTVNYDTNSSIIHGELIECSRGQSILSLQSWAKLFGRGWSIKRVRTFLDLLKKDGMIVTEGLTKTTRLSVCKYDTYQDVGQTKGKQKANKRQTEGKQKATTKESKEYKEDKEYIHQSRFDLFWDTYDYKVGRADTEKKWNALSEETKDKIFEHLKKYIPSTPDVKFRKHPATYLNKQSWNDVVVDTSQIRYTHPQSIPDHI